MVVEGLTWAVVVDLVTERLGNDWVVWLTKFVRKYMSELWVDAGTPDTKNKCSFALIQGASKILITDAHLHN